MNGPRFITVSDIGARRLVREVWKLVDAHIIDARSPAGDAALDLRDEIDKDWHPTLTDVEGAA